MEVVHGIASLPLPDTEPSVVTVGFFDGVHLGHREVLRAVVARARERGVVSVAITFDRHPREVLSPGSEPRLLTSVERKARLIEATGIDVLVVLAFDRDFSLIPAEDFVRDVLVDGVHAVHAVMGANFTFGFRALGTMGNLPSLGAPFGLTAETVQLVRTGERTISSTSIREALGRALFHAQHYEQAAAEFQAVADRAPTNDYALFCLGRSMQLLGRHREACQPLALACSLRPEREDYRLYRDRARRHARSTGVAGIVRRSTAGPTRRSAWNRCTSSRSCWGSRETFPGSPSRSSSGSGSGTRSATTGSRS